ncbi:MAG: divergent polysaccharide deacetylase family protein [Magnetovibrio sp.]|nr:divergent polysaccharide deacetylase family protein [Magnetovibrio sp.]
MARKNVTHKTKLKTPKKGPARAKRQAKKHYAQHQALRLKVLLGPIARIFAKLPPKFHVPGMRHTIETPFAAAFMIVLGVAVGGGYLGAQALFDAPTLKKTPKRAFVQQSLDGLSVILPEPHVDDVNMKRAYEEKVVDEVYVPLAPTAVVEAAVEVAVAPVSGPVSGPVDVATLKPPSQQGGADRPAWLKNALPFTPTAGRPMIALVIDDMGVDRKRSKRMWENVQAPLTLSFMTYANDLLKQTKAARAKGHEMMLHMSMEPSDASIDAGPNVLLTAMKDQELTKITNWGLDRFDGYIGVNNHMGSLFTENAHAMRVVLEQVKKRGVLFLDSRTSPKSVAGRVARELGMPTLVRNVFIDNDNEIDKVLKQLGEAERLARKRGVAIAIGHPREATIQALKTWIPNALERGLAIVPLSTVMIQRLARKEN